MAKFKLADWQIQDIIALTEVGASIQTIKEDVVVTEDQIREVLAKYQPGSIQLESKEQVTKRIMKDFSNADDLLSDL